MTADASRAMEPRPDRDPEAHPGVALFRFIRYWARRAPQRNALEATGSSGDVRRVLLVDIVAAAEEDDVVADVRLIAETLSVDRSVASRMVSDAVQAGLIERGVAAHDSRHAALALTAAGRELVEAARRWQDKVFDHYTTAWDPQEREVFARLLVKFVEASTR